jgi:hypothetical protein
MAENCFQKRHTGVLEGTPSSEAALREAHGEMMSRKIPAMRYFTVEERRFSAAKGENYLVGLQPTCRWALSAIHFVSQLTWP